jgi:hypothetical protein
MRSNSWIFLLGLSVGSLVGCGVDGSSSSETVVRVSEALTAYSQSVDLAHQALIFAPPSGTSAVDVHLAINGSRNTNVRMAVSGSSYRLGPLALRADDRLSYYFTYFRSGVATTTPTFNYVVPLTFQPLALLPRVDPGASAADYVIQLKSITSFLWADVHYTINNGIMQNVRVPASGLHVALNTGDALHYTMTYAVGTWVFDTAAYDYVPTAAAFGYTWVNENQADVPQAPGSCTTSDGGSTFSCPPWAFSKIFADGGYHSTSTSFPLVPVTVTLANSTYQKGNFTTLDLGFSYTGATPRLGTGLALIPTALGGNGDPPSSAAESLAGKNVSQTPGLISQFMVGGSGLAIALVDINGIWSNKVDMASHILPGSCDTPNCFFRVALTDFTQGSAVDLTQIRYVAVTTEAGATVNPRVILGDILFSQFE